MTAITSPYERASRSGSEYTSWRAMKTRCLNRRASQYRYYGGRGIRVCERWLSFDNFFADMGTKPTREHTIERRDRNGNYEPSNCYWLHRSRQSHNSSNTHLVMLDGITDSLAGWAKRIGAPARFLRVRIQRGWSAERAIRQAPSNRGKNTWSR